jgi:hypothetical protein
VFYNATRRLVLQGVDGVVFVADSQADMKQSNLESLKNLVENLASYGKKIEELPFVIQYNKRDLRQILPVRQMNALLNPRNVPAVEGIAKDGVGVSETLVTISRMVFSTLRKTLLMPGEEAEHKEIGDLTEAKIRKSVRPREVEPLEEISDIEEIQEVREASPAEEEPVPLEAVESVPDEIEIEISEPAPAPPEPVGFVIEEIEIPEPAPVPPPVEEPAIPRAEAVAPGREVPESGDEIDIEIPEPAPVPPPARASRVGVSLETEAEGFTFLKFEPPYVAPQGHAVLPAVFMDDRGNIVRLRIRITIEERG